jgi:hypothetical protein
VYFSVPRTIALMTGGMLISDPVTIAGPSANNAIVSAGGLSAVFNTSPAPTGSAINISGLTITGGNNSFSAGGGIVVGDESLTLTNCNITGNTAVDGGGGINVQSAAGSLNIQNCSINNNEVTGSGYCGGGIHLQGATPVTISGSTISGNTANKSGGGIYFNNGGSLLLFGSTLSGNKATIGTGGGLYFFGTVGAGKLTVINSTIAGNTSGSYGGGIALPFFSGTLTVQNSTITANVASGGSGGGISRPSGSGTIAIESSVVSGNTNATATDIFSGGQVTMKTSAVGSAAGFSETDQGGNLPFQPFANLLLGPPTNNGGPTQTCMPAYNSPLVGQGSNPASAFYDQRGMGYPRGAVGQIDIGAVQVNDLVVRNANDSGGGSLRQAITNANALTGADTITFDPAYFNIPRTISLTSGDLAITDAVTIAGPGAALATVNGGGISRVFDTTQALAGSAINISGLTITGGYATSSGGGILVYDEAVTLTNCVLTNNVAGFSSSGGAVEVYFPSGSLSLESCKVTNNSAQNGGSGGAIDFNGGKITIDKSTISNNSATAVGGAATFHSGAQVTITDSTFSGNTAGIGGGGLYFSNCNSMLMTGSTVSGNSAANGSGGGIDMVGSAGATGSTIRNCTISGNSCQQNGGGIAVSGLAAPLNLQNTTLTANTAASSAGGISADSTSTVSIVSTVVSGNSNINAPDISSPGTVNVNWSAIGSLKGFTLSGANNLPIGVNVKLGPLANNGGPTLTRMPAPDSPLIDQGSNPANVATDQRGMARFVGNNIDIGSVEFQGMPPHVQSVVINGGATQRSRVTTVAVTFDSHVTLPAAPETAFQLQRQSDGKLPALTAAVDDSGTSTVVTLTFSGTNAVDFGSLADGRYTLTVFASKVSESGLNLDGNGDGTGGDDYTLVGDPATNKLYRFYGDINGDGTVSASDFIQFRQYFGGVNPAFDFNNDGSVAASDFIQFRLRFGGSI